MLACWVLDGGCSKPDVRCSKLISPLRVLERSRPRLPHPRPAAQRLVRRRIAAAQARRAADESEREERLLIFDEPTTGLHFDDIALLVRVFDRLVEQGNSAARHRAQSRSHQMRRLRHRSRAGSRRAAAGWSWRRERRRKSRRARRRTRAGFSAGCLEHRTSNIEHPNIERRDAARARKDATRSRAREIRNPRSPSRSHGARGSTI